MNLLKEGDVVILKAGTTAAVNRGPAMPISEDQKCVVTDAYHVAPGMEDDHFEACYIVCMKPLTKDDGYDHKAPTYTVAQFGDFKDKYLIGEITPIGHMVKSYLRQD